MLVTGLSQICRSPPLASDFDAVQTKQLSLHYDTITVWLSRYRYNLKSFESTTLLHFYLFAILHHPYVRGVPIYRLCNFLNIAQKSALQL